jgi:hypothetical protein
VAGPAAHTSVPNVSAQTGLATQDPMTKKITPQRRVHDFRRTAAREFRRAGVSDGEILRLCGWETPPCSTATTSATEQDLTRAVAWRRGTVVAQLDPSKASSPSLS